MKNCLLYISLDCGFNKNKSDLDYTKQASLIGHNSFELKSLEIF